MANSASSTEGSSGGDGRRRETEKKIINCKNYYEFHDRMICNYGNVGNISTGDGHSGEMVASICTCQYQNKQQEEMAKYLEAWTDGMVATAAFKKVMEMLNIGTTWITIKGSPGEGKTTVAYMALRELQKSGRQVFQARSPEEFTGISKTCSRPVILLDDVFGQLDFDQTAWIKWKDVFHKVLDLKEHISHQLETKRTEKNKITVFLVGRNYVFNPASVQMGRLYNTICKKSRVVDMSHSVERPPDEKHRIWDAIVGPSDINIPWQSISNISKFGGGHGFPHVCRLFVTICQTNTNISAEKFFRAPLTFLNETIALFLENDSKLNLFMEMIAREGKINERDLQVSNYKLVKTAKELLGTYLRMENGYFVFDHPSIYDSVAFNMCKHHTMFVIQNCELSFIHERIRLEPPSDEVSVPLSECTDLVMYISQSYVTDLAKRFAHELSNSENWLLVLSHQACSQEVFVKEMMSQLKIPLGELVHMYCMKYEPHTENYHCLLTCDTSPQLLKYVGSHSDMQLSERDINTVLYKVCVYAASDILSYLLEADRHTLDINARYGYMKRTPLMMAAESRDSQCVHTILSLSPDLSARDWRCRTALHYLCENGLGSAVSHVVDKVGGIDEEDRYGHSPLSYACGYNHVHVVSLLLDRGAKIDNDLLRCAIQCSGVHMFKALFDRLNRNDLPDDVFDAVIEKAAKCDIKSVFDNLSHALCDRMDKDTFSDLLGKYLLMSSEYDNVEVLQILLNSGGHVNDTYDSRAPVHVACERGAYKSLQFLLDHGADVNIEDQLNRSPLVCTILSYDGTVECFELLLKAGADKSALSNYRSDGGSVLHALMKQYNWKLKEWIDVLVKAGLDVNEQTEDGQTLLHLELCRESDRYGWIGTFPFDIPVCQTFITHGADVNIQDTEGNTPLHLLSRIHSHTRIGILSAKVYKRHYRQMVKLLVDHGADVNKLNNKGQLALRGWMKRLLERGESESKFESGTLFSKLS